MIELSYFTYIFLWVKPFRQYQSQGYLSKSRSNIKVTVLEKMAIAGALVFHQHILFHNVLEKLFLTAVTSQGLFSSHSQEHVKHVRKVFSGVGKKSCVSTGVRKPGNTYASPTAMI